MVTIKASDLKGEDVILFDECVSNGYWLVRRSALTNAPMFADEATVRAFAPGVQLVHESPYKSTGLDAMPKGELTEVRDTGLSVVIRAGYRDKRGTRVLVYHGDGVGFVGIKEEYVKLLNLADANLWCRRTGDGADDVSAMIDMPGRDEATICVMPHNLADVPKWLRAPVVEAAEAADGGTVEADGESQAVAL